jgi:hypothetical protein
MEGESSHMGGINNREESSAHMTPVYNPGTSSHNSEFVPQNSFFNHESGYTFDQNHELGVPMVPAESAIYHPPYTQSLGSTVYQPSYNSYHPHGEYTQNTESYYVIKQIEILIKK